MSNQRILIDTGPSARGWHRQETFRFCPRLYAYKYKLGLPLGSREPLVRGTLGHTGLAHYYARLKAEQSGQDPDMFYTPLDAVDLMVERLSEREGEESRIFAEKWRIPIKSAVDEYMVHYAMERLEIVAVEEAVTMMFGPEQMTQRFDLAVRDSGGRIWVWDHKFVGRIDAATTRRYTLSGQFLEMVWQSRQKYGDAFAGLRINVVSTKPVGKFERVTPDPAPDALQAFPQDVVDTEGLIRQLEQQRPDPWTWGPRMSSEKGCQTIYGMCDGYELCRWGKAALPELDACK